MSGLLAGKVWQSALDPKLKPLAAALADIANDDGTSIYPSVAYVAWLLGNDAESTSEPRMESTIHRGIAALKQLGVLEQVGRRRASKGRSNSAIVPEYWLNETALPARKPWDPRHTSSTQMTPLPVQKGGGNLTPLDDEGVSKEPEGVSKTDEGVSKTGARGGMGDTQTVIDPSLDPSTDPSALSAKPTRDVGTPAVDDLPAPYAEPHDFLDAVKMRVTRQNFAAYVAPCSLREENRTLIFTAPNDLIGGQLERTFRGTLREIAASLGFAPEVRVEVEALTQKNEVS